MKEISMFVAEDGTTFKSAKECLKYENILAGLELYKIRFKNKSDIIFLITPIIAKNRLQNNITNINIISMLLGFNMNWGGEVYKIIPGDSKDISNIVEDTVYIFETEDIPFEDSETLKKYASKHKYGYMDYYATMDLCDKNYEAIKAIVAESLYLL